jgi:hypothetical protein
LIKHPAKPSWHLLAHQVLMTCCERSQQPTTSNGWVGTLKF